MDPSRPTTIERAFEVARSGKVSTVAEIKIQLRAEGYHDAMAHLSGWTLAAELRKVIAAARAAP